MRYCCVCDTELTSTNEGIDHIRIEACWIKREAFICQTCLNAVHDQLEYGISYACA